MVRVKFILKDGTDAPIRWRAWRLWKWVRGFQVRVTW